MTCTNNIKYKMHVFEKYSLFHYVLVICWDYYLHYYRQPCPIYYFAVFIGKEHRFHGMS